jgi:hypothetical protein
MLSLFYNVGEVNEMKTKILRVLGAGISISAICISAIPVLAEGDGQPPSAPSGDASGGGNAPSGNGGGGGADTQTYDYAGTLSGAKTADGTEESSDNEEITADQADQNGLLAQNKGTLTVKNGTIKKSGDDDDGDNCNFYGINSVSLTVGEGSLSKISDTELGATSTGSNGIFATDSGTAYANNDVIETTADNSRGLDATYSGTILANKMTISTQGQHSAAIATDRGGGSVSVTNSKLTTSGSGSPLLYSTGDIEVDNVTGKASGSQIAGMEGLNTILIYNSNLSSTITKATASDPVADGVIIYQSTSGDAESTTGEAASFQVSDSTLSSDIESGSMFYVTNTTANIVLKNTKLSFDSNKANLLQVEGNDANSWGTAGSNGAAVKFTGIDQTLNGNIVSDTISTADVYLLSGTVYTGSASIETNSVNTNVSSAPLTMNVSSDSKWVVTGDSTVTNLNVEDGGKVVDDDGKTVTIVANGTTVVDGDSDITVTVTGSYGTTVATGTDNELSTSYIDRTDFDSTYSVSTEFGTNASGKSSSADSSNVTSAVTSAVTDAASSENAPIVIVIIAACAAAAAIVFYTLHKKKIKK